MAIPRDGGTCPACESGYHDKCLPVLNDGTLCDCAAAGHPVADQVVVHVSDEEPCVLSELDYGDPVCIHGYATMLVWREVDPEPPC